jgi:hypothetical protein
MGSVLTFSLLTFSPLILSPLISSPLNPLPLIPSPRFLRERLDAQADARGWGCAGYDMWRDQGAIDPRCLINHVYPASFLI